MKLWNKLFPGEDEQGYDRLTGESEEDYKARLKGNLNRAMERREADKVARENAIQAANDGLIDPKDVNNYIQQKSIENEMLNRGCTKLKDGGWKGRDGQLYYENGDPAYED